MNEKSLSGLLSIYLLATINVKMPSNQGIPMKSPHFDKAAFSTKI